MRRRRSVMMRRCASYAAALLVSLSGVARTQTSAVSADPPPVMREMRAIWIATVDNLDWPSQMGLSSDQQKSEMLAILDKAVALHMNAVIFQVRPGADALYASKIEPWSEYLTGEMGRAPSPFYDPLTFTIAEAHKRGLELHVWINPYRARFSTKRKASASHISRANPGLVRKYGPYIWMDPGDPAVRERTKKVVFDLVKRYDIDGVHMDDYFYPYKELKRGKEIPFPDNSTWKRYTKSGGKLGRDDWRRHNVDLLVQELYEGVHKVKPDVRFGISPFGIWRPGNPESVRGLDQYSELYADAKKWWNEGWVDYLVPQLYWQVDRPQQRYDVLLEWWVQQNLHGRNLWAGNYTGKIAFTNSSAWRTGEILEQIRLTRAQPGASGNVHFSAKVFLQDPDSVDEQLVAGPYATPALVPASPWLPSTALTAPVLSAHADSLSGNFLLDVRAGAAARTTPAIAPWLWVIQARTDSGWTTIIRPATERSMALSARFAVPPSEVRVMAVDRVGNTGPSSRLVFAR